MNVVWPGRLYPGCRDCTQRCVIGHSKNVGAMLCTSDTVLSTSPTLVCRRKVLVGQRPWHVGFDTVGVHWSMYWD